MIIQYLGINRNIVECKVPRGDMAETGVPLVLIETLWNVKLYMFAHRLIRASVLIETLWNVKKYSVQRPVQFLTVLIETLWNVK